VTAFRRCPIRSDSIQSAVSRAGRGDVLEIVGAVLVGGAVEIGGPDPVHHLEVVVVVVLAPLNIRCSKRWAKPVLPGFSFFEPTWYQMFTATMGALWSSCTSTGQPVVELEHLVGMSGSRLLFCTFRGGLGSLGLSAADAGRDRQRAAQTRAMSGRAP
jgi:hypothetical protein